MDHQRMRVVLIVAHMVEIDSSVVGISATWLYSCNYREYRQSGWTWMTRIKCHI